MPRKMRHSKKKKKSMAPDSVAVRYQTLVPCWEKVVLAVDILNLQNVEENVDGTDIN